MLEDGREGRRVDIGEQMETLTANNITRIVSYDIVDWHRRRAQDPVIPQTEDFANILLSVQKETRGDEVLSDLHISQLILVERSKINNQTLATVVTWIMMALMMYPSVREQDELDSVGRDRLVDESDLPQLRYLKAFVRETVRFYPVRGFLLPHESVEVTKVAGYHIPSETKILVSLRPIYNDSQISKDPEAYPPEILYRQFDRTQGLPTQAHAVRFRPEDVSRCEQFAYRRAASRHTCLPSEITPETLDTREVKVLTLHSSTSLKLHFIPRLPAKELFT
ncbi:hypothetical protein R1flu_012840 [Riccia fluitans]|uniref:Cytochrome P450 n=1 Tax=Riccia fluitans TaxID=41844 RepID=A0ABD1ZBR4_9MARC